jgi:hypothetical protein
MIPLFDSESSQRSHEKLEEGAILLRGFAGAEAPVLVDEVARIASAAAFRHMITPGGYGQFSEGCSTRSMTTYSPDPLAGWSFNPSCASTAVKMDCAGLAPSAAASSRANSK